MRVFTRAFTRAYAGGLMYTKRERKRVTDKLARWQDRYFKARDEGNPETALAAAVDWLRAEHKLARDLLDDDGEGWTDVFIYDAMLTVAHHAGELCDEILKEIRK
jgi:hypothetical protein